VTRRHARQAAFLVLALLLHSAGSDAALASEPVPWTVRADVRWAEGGGTESVREAVERAAVQSATEANCVAGVSADPSRAADLVWTVLLVELEEETVYDESIYGVQMPGEPGKELLHTARIRIRLLSQVSRGDGGASERAKPIHVEESRRPRIGGEDTAGALRADVVRRVRGELGKALCRSAERLWRKEEATGGR
jgi:hypothetical protein